MTRDATTFRRVLGAACLTGALAMLIAGQTVLRPRLRDLPFLLYWFVCFLFTGAAILIAFLDARAVQRRTRREARDLLEATLNRIETDARNKPGPSQQADGS
jgi:membrane protein implicated in regulation of membrane protease activity